MNLTKCAKMSYKEMNKKCANKKLISIILMFSNHSVKPMMPTFNTKQLSMAELYTVCLSMGPKQVTHYKNTLKWLIRV